MPGILSWLHCFSLYAAVVGDHYQEGQGATSLSLNIGVAEERAGCCTI